MLPSIRRFEGVVKDAAVALSLANLYFLQITSVLLDRSPMAAYLSKRRPAPAEYMAVSIDILLLGALGFTAIRLARRACRPALINGVALATPLLLVIPFYGIWKLVARSILSQNAADPERFALPAALAFAALLSALALRFTGRFLNCCRVALLILFPLVLFTGTRAALALVLPSTAVRADGSITPFSETRTGKRVLWVIFDEWDYGVTFDRRPAGLLLPELDAFRSASVAATDAYPPAGETLSSLPALTTGRLVSAARPDGPDDLLLSFSGSTHPTRWSEAETIFHDFRRAGRQTALFGWYHPYSRVFHSALDHCSWREYSDRARPSGEGLLPTMLSQFRFILPVQSMFGELKSRRAHLETYEKILQDCKHAVTAREMGLVLAHFAIPHGPWIFDRTNGRLDPRDQRPDGYLDNLVLVDYTLRELHRTMERAGTWDSTTILLSSDHWFRQSGVVNGKRDHRVPFLLKLAGQSSGEVLTVPFNTVVTRQLLSAVLREEIVTSTSAVEWLKCNRTFGELRYAR